MAGFDKNLFSGHWVHSFEEDNPEELVFRPDTFSFPRSRGRRSIDIQASGKVLDLSPGKADVPESVSGNWNIDDQALVIHYADGTGERLQVKEVSPVKLVIRKY